MPLVVVYRFIVDSGAVSFQEAITRCQHHHVFRACYCSVMTRTLLGWVYMDCYVLWATVNTDIFACVKEVGDCEKINGYSYGGTFI